MIPREVAKEIDRLERQLRLLGGGTVRQAVSGRSASENGTTITDGCECNKSYNLEGIVLTGAPTVCCEGHVKWSATFGGSIGTKTLYHTGGDVWSTFNSDGMLDNPVTISCGSASDEYDLVMTLSATGASITLEARAALNCDEVCIEYQRALPFACKRAQQFNLIKHSGTTGMSLTPCVCVFPANDTVPCEYCEAGVAPEGPVHADFGTPSGTAFCNLLSNAGGDVQLETSADCEYTARVYNDPEVLTDYIDYVVRFESDRVRAQAVGRASGFTGGTIGDWWLLQDAPHDCTQRVWSLPLQGTPPCSGWPDPLVVTVSGTGEPDDSGHCTGCGEGASA